MAIPNNYIDKITNKDTGESRIISPAADKVRVENENFEGADLDEVLDEVAQAIEDAGSGDGTVTGVKVGSTTYEPTEGVVDISPAIPDTSGLATNTEVTQGLAEKVDKETGKGLSTNDYSDADKTKLAGIETGAEKNVISGIKANGASETLPVENGIVTLPPAASPISPATAAPLEDGTAGVGSSEKYAREDHRHPHDSSKQDALTFDNAPTAGSNNPVKSGGIKTALDAKADAATTYNKTEVDSAINNKLTEVTVTEISDAADVIVIDDADLAFIDEDGNIVMQVREGHVETQNFDSRQVGTNAVAIQQLQSQIGQASQPVQTDVLVKQDDDAAFDISDVNGNVIMRINNKGHISTKGFDSENMDIFRATKLDSPQCACHGYGSVSSVQANTIAYFRAGYTAGYRFFECDAINCSDGVPVCTHDNNNGLTVYDKTTHEATNVSIASVSGTRTIQMSSTDLVDGYTWDSAGNVPIALLSDVIWQVCYFYRCPLHIDGQGLNKASRYAASQYAETLGVGQYVFHELQSGAYTDWDIPCNAIVAAGTVASIVEKANAYKKADNNIIFYLTSSTAVSSVKTYASAAHAVGCYLLSWTFTSAADARAWFAEGADFLITSNSITNNKI